MISLDEYSKCDAVDLLKILRKKEISVKELAQAALTAVEKVNPSLNAVIETYPERLDSYNEDDLLNKPLGGVPFFFKDLGPTEIGKKCDWGSHFSKDIIAEETTYLTDRFHDAGLCNLGRTTCPEFGFAISTESRLTGITRNPWNTDKSPGGSSGGSTAIVAAGVVPMAHTNDGAGSTRVPSSMCGLVGLKCSRGTISLGPGAGDVQYPLYSEFVASRTVRDTAAMFDAISGPMPGESIYTGFRKPRNESANGHAGRRKIAISSTRWGNYEASAHIKSELHKIAPTLEALGYEVEFIDPPIDFEEFHHITMQFFSLMGMIEIDTMARITGREIKPELFETVSYRLYQQGKSLGIQTYIHALERMNHYSRILGEFYQTYDFYVTPTLAKPIPDVGELSLDRDISVDEYYHQWHQTSPYVGLNNFTGTPAINIPLSSHENGLPLGIHFTTAIGGERDLIRIASQLEEALPWSARRPVIHVANDLSQIQNKFESRGTSSSTIGQVRT